MQLHSWTSTRGTSKPTRTKAERKRKDFDREGRANARRYRRSRRDKNRSQDGKDARLKDANVIDAVGFISCLFLLVDSGPQVDPSDVLVREK